MKTYLVLLVAWLLLIPVLAFADDAAGSADFVYLHDAVETTLIRVYMDGTQETFDLGLDTNLYLPPVGPENMLFSADGLRAVFCRVSLPEREVALVLRDIEAQADLFVTELDTDEEYCELRQPGFNEDETLIAVGLLPDEGDVYREEPPTGRLLMVDATNGAVVDSVDGWQPPWRFIQGRRYWDPPDSMTEMIWADFDPTQTFPQNQPYPNVVMYAREGAEPYRIFVADPALRISDVVFIEGGARVAVLLTEPQRAISEDSRWMAVDREGRVSDLNVQYGPASTLRGTSDGFLVLNLHNTDAASGRFIAQLYRSVGSSTPQIIAEVLYDRTPFTLAWMPGWDGDPDAPAFPFADWYGPFPDEPGLG